MREFFNVWATGSNVDALLADAKSSDQSPGAGNKQLPTKSRVNTVLYSYSKLILYVQSAVYKRLVQRRGRWKSASGSSRSSIWTACAPSSARTRSGRSSSACAPSQKASRALCAPTSRTGRSGGLLLRFHSNSSGPHFPIYRPPISRAAVKSWVELEGSTSAGRRGTRSRRGECLHRDSDHWRALRMWTAASSVWRVSHTRGNRFESTPQKLTGFICRK